MDVLEIVLGQAWKSSPYLPPPRLDKRWAALSTKKGGRKGKKKKRK